MLGTRGSELARAQTAMVEQALRVVQPGLEIAIQVITTRGDEKGDAILRLAASREEQGKTRRDGRKGLFTHEIERALLDREIDAAVHSAKDLPSDMDDRLRIVAVLPRAPVEDVLISKGPGGLAALPQGAVVGTGSIRRLYQLRWNRSDLGTFDLRGNVPTRLRKLEENPWEAIILARAGIERLGYTLWSRGIRFGSRDFHAEILNQESFLPAGGQGIVAIQVRSDDRRAAALVERISHAETLSCLAAEREFLRLLEGDCDTPVGTLATITADVMTLRAHIFDEDHVEPKRGSLDSPAGSPLDLAQNLWRQLYGREKK